MMFEAWKVLDNQRKFFPHFQPKYTTALDLLESYNPVTLPSQTFMIGGKCAEDTKVGITVL